MDLKLVDVLRCPVSGGPLRLEMIEGDSDAGRQVVKTGVLLCPESRLWYPVVNYVPVMLAFHTGLAEKFAQEHGDLLALQVGYAAPTFEPFPGEQNVQSTFTEEWSGLGDDPLTFVYTDGELIALHREVWLHLPPDGDPAATKVLDVGCGFGQEAIALAEIFPNADVFAVDLNFSLVKAAPSLIGHRRLHPIIASLFRLPFTPDFFDHVHSQGVIHHTFSTKKAFDSIARFARPGGTLFVWVYAKEDGLTVPGVRGVLTRTYLFTTNNIGRPVLSRLPPLLRGPAVAVLAALLHPVYRSRSRHGSHWRLRNTLHSVRDVFTPRYAHLHGFNEVLTWFEDGGFSTTMQSPARYRELFGKPLLGIGVLGHNEIGTAS